MPQNARDVELVRDRFLSIASDFGGHPPTFRRLCRRRMARLQLAVYRFLEKPSGFLARFYHFGALLNNSNISPFSSRFRPHFSALFPQCPLRILKLRFPCIRPFPRILFGFLFARRIRTPHLGRNSLQFFPKFPKLFLVGVDAHFHGLWGRFAFLCRPVCLIDLIVLCASFFVLFYSNSNPNEGKIDQQVEIKIIQDVKIFPQNQNVAFLQLAPFPKAHLAVDQLRFLQILRPFLFQFPIHFPISSLLHVDRQMIAFSLIRRMIRRSFFELFSAYYITFMIFLALAVCVFTTEQWAEESDAKIEGGNSTEIRRKTFRHFGDSFWFSIVTVLTIGYGDIVPRGWLSKLAICLFSYLGLSMFSTASGLVGVGMSLMLSGEKQQRQQSKMRDAAARLIQSWIRFHLISDGQKFGRIRVYRKFCAKLEKVEERIGKAREMVKMAAERRKGGGKWAKMLQKYSPMQERRGKSDGGRMGPEEQIGDEFSDEEKILEYFYGQRSHSNSLLSNKSEEAANVPDEFVNGRHRSILRMCYFFTFICVRKKFKRLRRPYELMDAEAELCELEQQRLMKFKELEMRLDTQLGSKSGRSILGREEGDWGGILERMEMCEQKMEEMERKAELAAHLATLILGRFQKGMGQ